MSTTNKLDNLRQRQQEVERELTDLSAALRQSQNTALPDMEAVLMAELRQIERQIGKLHEYLDHCKTTPAGEGVADAVSTRHSGGSDSDRADD